MGRFQVKNIKAEKYFCVEKGRLLGPGESTVVSRVDFGTRKDGQDGKVEITDLDKAAPHPPKKSSTAPKREHQAKAQEAAQPAPVSLPEPPKASEPDGSSPA